jgi:acetyl-CoA carboxylase carboxyltransferase component
MGLEGAVKLGFKKELDALDDPAEKQALYDKLVRGAYKQGKAMNAAAALEFDEVIDPKDTRRWILHGLESFGEVRKSGRMVDCW